MGLLDNGDDLLSLGMGLLAAGGPSRTPVNFGQALAAGYGQMQQGKQQRMLDEQRQMQMEEYRRKVEQEKVQQAAIANLQGSIPDALKPYAQAFPQEVSKLMLGQAFQKPESMFDKVNPKDFTPESVAKFSQSRNYADLMPVEKQTNAPDVVKLMTARDALPPGHPNRAILEQAINKASTHQAPVNVSYGAPVAGVDPVTNNPVFFQPSKDGIKPPAIIPGVIPSPKGAGSASEDERKAAGWLSQTNNAWQNMKKVGLDERGEVKKEVYPGIAESFLPEKLANNVRSSPRQQFVQASSSMSEALLRAATGAGVNKDEAAQKVAELTPQLGDKPEVINQKMAAIPIYIKSLEQRAGRALVPTKQEKTVTKRGTYNGRKVVQYSDGSTEYAD